ncbi:mitochondrial division protein 1 [Coccidioides immitis RMSCC 3703]|uniref:Mitochondrial division protein 1 n=1 Tax=Coccidioides immitis RMSCC 3703 TaxID=454286 RepID=A0A0J8QTN8_COCIT|nr:mitochondrial division protein 1 [Coccidioides immitis RMSCC 3703]
MADPQPRSDSPSGQSAVSHDEDEGSVLGTGLTTRHIEAFGRKVTTTASHLMAPKSDPTLTTHYQSAMSDIQRELRRPTVQRKVFSFAQTTPTDLVRSKLSTSEIQYRALSALPDELLANIPEDTSTYSLFQGFQASMPEDDNEHRKSHRRRRSHGQKLLEDSGKSSRPLPQTVGSLKRERDVLNRRLELMGIRKNMCSAEIHEIDNKIANLNNMRKIVLDRLAGLEMDEAELEHELVQLDNRLEDMEEAMEESATLISTPKAVDDEVTLDSENQAMDASFMSESIYEKIPSPKAWKHKSLRKRSMPILHEHFEPGSMIRELQAHNDMITAMDFDVPFGTMVSSALDDTVRVWDLNLGRCMGFLEGHHASVRCLQVENNIVATGSMDASIRLWDLSRASYAPRDNRITRDDEEDDDDALGYEDPSAEPPPPPPSSMEDCPLFSLEAHVDEVTALHFRGDTLISGSADKTLRQWDLVKGRCVQTLDVLWAAAQASSIMGGGDSQWRPTGRLPDASADFVGALQCFDAALACGTADGMIRLWDLRSGQVHRSLVGHTGPITCLQFDDVHLITGVRPSGTSAQDLSTTHTLAAAGEDVVKVYDKTDGRHWDCGAGVTAEEEGITPAIVERVRIKDGYLTEGRKDGTIGIWTC